MRNVALYYKPSSISVGKKDLKKALFDLYITDEDLAYARNLLDQLQRLGLSTEHCAASILVVGRIQGVRYEREHH